MTTLKRIRNNQEKKDHLLQEKINNYIPPEAICLVTKILKDQNLYLIDWICSQYGLAESEKEILIDKFIKINYFCPNKILSRNKEKLQKIFI